MRRKLISRRTAVHCAVAAGVIAATGCAHTAVRSGGTQPGAASAREAAEQFLHAVRAEDIQAMSLVWGTSRGPTRDTMERRQLEQRAIILQCFLAHDQYRVVSETPGVDGRRVVRVVLTRGQYSRQPALYAIRGPGGRWYVEDIDIAAVRDFCGDPGNIAPPSGRPPTR